jgi:hypothetical protein
MGFFMEFDSTNNILRVTLEGPVTDANLSGAYAAAAGYVVLHGPCRGIVDLSKVTKFEVSTTLIQEQAEGASAFPNGYLRIFVAPTNFLYGMARMFELLCQENRPDLRVVRTMDEAHHLLRVESPEFVAVS